MKKNWIAYTISISLSVLFCPSLVFGGSATAFQNLLEPFATDGCTDFPNGIPYVDPNRWLLCCVNHDLAYWKGGSSEEKNVADSQLRQCISDEASPGLGDAVFLGVQVGGLAQLPTSWRWGFGWVVPRSDEPLNAVEQAEVDLLSQQIPKDLRQMPIKKEPAFPVRGTVTGDYCLDMAEMEIFTSTGQSVLIEDQKENTQLKGDVFWKTLTLKTMDCDQPYKFTFLLLHKDSCQPSQNDLEFRGRVQLLRSEVPQSCAVDK